MEPRIPLYLLLLCLPALNRAFEIPTSWGFWRRTDSGDGYHNPKDNGGALLTKVINTFPPDQGEPINAIITAKSDADVLVDQEEDGGLRNYFLSLSFSGECLGQRSGNAQQANLGDGKGYVNQTAVIRYNYGDAELGACTETIKGGNHFRYWVQDGDQADSGAIFLAVSYELPIAAGHDIVLNGYNLGRDYLVGNITHNTIPTLNLTDTSKYSGETEYDGYKYHTDVSYVSGLLDNTSMGINHNWSVYIDGVTNAVDGLVAILDVSIIDRPVERDFASHLTSSAWCLLLVLVASFSTL